jgi:hypothetical protein
MSQRKTKRDAAAEKMADLLIEHMEETMTPAQAKAMIGDLKSFSKKSRRFSRREKPSRVAKSVGSRPLSHARVGTS